jgi:hypothetical protein
MTRALLALAALGAAAGIALGFLRLAAERSAPRQRCGVCGRELPEDPLDAAPVCSWHWGVGGDA